jgi:hypothetical protein
MFSEGNLHITEKSNILSGWMSNLYYLMSETGNFNLAFAHRGDDPK